MARPRTTRPPRQTGAVDPPPVGPDPIEPPIEPPDLPDITFAFAFEILDDELPLALFPVRLEARFLPDNNPTEIVVRVFPDEIVADSHVAGFTATELELARRYWDWIWRAAGDPAAVAQAREWLAGELGPYRAIYVAYASRPTGNPPKTPTPPGKDLVPPLVLRSVPMAGTPTPGRARLLPLRWAAFVEVESEVAGPFWSAEQPDPDLPVSPALVDLPPARTRRASWTRRTSGGRTTSRSPSRRGWSSGSRSRLCRTGRPRDITVCSSSASRRAAITARR